MKADLEWNGGNASLLPTNTNAYTPYMNHLKKTINKYELAGK